ncbi:unnamed protein product [Caenorhabditis auriculariae]|uniref:Vacuolar protein sorting-associated protein 35 n=1 Tax=Caenorhabditis auriculariae TaxID=2777116 RepID=A0A8S1HLN4_9PELO|nr:unnamed protein product [Caenorhabditis auriculariae]
MKKKVRDAKKSVVSFSEPSLFQRKHVSANHGLKDSKEGFPSETHTTIYLLRSHKYTDVKLSRMEAFSKNVKVSEKTILYHPSVIPIINLQFLKVTECDRTHPEKSEFDVDRRVFDFKETGFAPKDSTSIKIYLKSTMRVKDYPTADPERFSYKKYFEYSLSSLVIPRCAKKVRSTSVSRYKCPSIDNFSIFEHLFLRKAEMYEAGSGVASAAEQEKMLETATKVVKAESFEMKRCLDKGKVMDALKHALSFLNELRTNDLSPKFYYRLYMDSVNELQHLESFLVEDFQKDSGKLANLYECVQYASQIIPRLYLLVTMGVVFIKCGLGSRQELLADLVEMCRGVQHPLRGLFLRNYLLQSTRSLLPDRPESVARRTNGSVDANMNGSSGPKESLHQQDGSVTDAVNFVLTNFGEMNKLWVRMQHQGPSREREKRERDRLELRILVGTNLVRLSQLESLTEEMYTKDVLPSVLEQIVSCRDPISQEYLMECVIQVFADEFHLSTLNEFLAACGQLTSEVNVKNVLIGLIERLAFYTNSIEGEPAPEKMQLFEIFSEQAKELITNRPEMPMEDIVSLHVALVNLAIKCYATRTDYANMSFGTLRTIINEKGITAVEAFGTVGRELIKLLKIPVDQYNNVLRVAALEEFGSVMQILDYRGRCVISSYIIQNMLDQETLITNEEEFRTVCGLISPLLEDQKDQPSDAHESEDFFDEQHILARVVHLLRVEDADQQFLLLNNARKVFGSGGRHRLQFTLPPIVFELYRLVLSYAVQKGTDDKWEAKVRKMFVCAMGTIGALVSTVELAELPLKLYLEGAIAADKVPFSENYTVVYEFISKAMSIMEDDVADSRDRVRCLQLTVGALLCTKNFPEENWQPLATQAAMAASKMFKKADQVRSLCMVAALYWNGCVEESNGAPLKNGKRVVEILKKSAKIASECMEPLVQQQLFILLLNTYIHYYEDGCKEIDVHNIDELVSRTQDNAVQLDVSAEADLMEKHLTEAIKQLKIARQSAESDAALSPPSEIVQNEDL